MAGDALRTSEERLSLALTASKMGVWEWNVQDQRHEFWSPEAIGISGVESFNGEYFESFTNSFTPMTPTGSCPADQAMAEKTTFSMEYRIIRPDGQDALDLGLARPGYDEKGIRCGADRHRYGHYRAKTGGGGLRRSETSLPKRRGWPISATGNGIPYPAKIPGPMNSTGYSAAFPPTMVSWNWFIPMTGRWYKQSRTPLTGHRLSTSSYRIVQPDGTIRVIHAKGEAESVMTVSRSGLSDSSGYHRTQADGREARYPAANRLIARAAELEAANIELEAFNYTVSHDLRKPLTVINGYCQVIKELCGNQLDEDCKEYLREVYEGTLRMNRLIDTLLNFSRVARVEMRREKVDLSDMAQEVAAELRLAEPERRVTFRIAEGITADGDAGLLRVVLDNLLGNAWKYTGKREETVIEFGVTEIDGKPACFVRDNGPDSTWRMRTSCSFPSSASPARRFEGHGIGLATVERIIRRHGGRVWAEGKPGKGATFYFTLPGGFGGAAGRRA